MEPTHSWLSSPFSSPVLPVPLWLTSLPFSSTEINGTQICPNNLVAFHDFSSDLENVPHLRYLRLDGNFLKPPIPLDLMMCFRLLQSVVI
jgi:hypothetical protein